MQTHIIFRFAKTYAIIFLLQANSKNGEGTMIKIEELKGFSLFHGIDDDSLIKVAELCQMYPMNEGDKLFAEGTRATDVHFCHKGMVDLVIWVRGPWNKNVAIHRVQPGELFGWSALVAPYTYTASAECVESGEELRIKGYELLSLIDKECTIGYAIMRNLGTEISSRLAQTRQRLSTELLSGGSQSGANTWGETGKR